MSNKNYEKTLKKVSDMFELYNYLIEEIDKTKLDSKVFKSFVSNSMILKICELDKKEYKEYKRKLKKVKIYNNLLVNSFKRKIKKILLQIDPKTYYKMLGK